MSPADTDFELEINLIYEKIKKKIVRLLQNSSLKREIKIEALAEFIIATVWGALSLSPKHSSKKSCH